MRPVRLFLVRHAQSIWQTDPSRGLDSGLSDLGVAQAQMLGAWLAQSPWLTPAHPVEIAALRTSPMARAMETTAAVADAMGLRFEVAEGLREASFHVESEVGAIGGPVEWRTIGPPSSLYTSFQEQVRRELKHLIETSLSSEASTMTIAHQGVIRCMLHLLGGEDTTLWFRVMNTGITLLEWDGGRWRVVVLGSADHLPVEMRTF